MTKGGWTKETKVAAVRLDAPVYDRMVELAADREESINDYLKWLIGTQVNPGKLETKR